jgi:hypothetical protein
VRVKMLTRAAGPDWKADAGVEIDLPLNVAAGLVSGGYAVAIEKAKLAPQPVMAPVVETAAVEPRAERAVKAKAKPRKK